MKIRTGFVANSSSASFIFKVRSSFSELIQVMNEIMPPYLLDEDDPFYPSRGEEGSANWTETSLLAYLTRFSSENHTWERNQYEEVNGVQCFKFHITMFNDWQDFFGDKLLANLVGHYTTKARERIVEQSVDEDRY